MQATFARILNMSLTGSIVIAVVLLARFMLKRAPKIYSYALWAVVLFRLLCPLSISASLSVLKPIPVTTTPGISAVSYRPVQQAVNISNQIVSERPESAERPEQAKPKPTPMEIGSYLWLTGASCMALYSLVQFLALRRSLVGAVPDGGAVYLSDHIGVPFVMGVLNPRVFLPSDTPKEERRFIIAHERHHIRRGDPMWKLLGYIALCLHWFNPLVWLAFCLAGKDMEMSCDEAVIKQLGEHIRADYSQALLRLSTHKRIGSGMPLAFGEGDTRSRVLNMAHWKKPKVWVSVLCVTLCLVILAACALNPKQEEKPLEEMTRVTGPAGIGAWELYFILPEGCTQEMQENGDRNWRDSREGCVIVMTDGTNTIGGVMAFPIPENYSSDNWDWFHALDLPEWQDETLGYSAGGAPGDVVTAEFFSDVPPGQERTVLNEHNLYFYDGWIYDLWFDKLTVKPEVMEAILNTVNLGEPKPNPTTLPYEIGDMPQGYDAGVTAEGNISISSMRGMVGLITSYTIPEGVYDPGDDAYLWLEDVGIPDLENPNLTISGMFSWRGSNGCALTVTDDFQNPTVKRTHHFRVAGNTLYDFWLDELLLDVNTQSAIEDAVVYQEATAQQSGAAPEPEISEEDMAFGKAQAVMMGLQDVPILIQTECQYQNTPEKDYIETFCYDSEIGFLSVTTTADGSDHAQLYVNDRYYTNAGSEANPEPIWVESEAPSEFSGPWLGSFNFIRHYVTYKDTLSDGEKTSYMFRVNALFEDTPDAADFYVATFHFDAEGNFIDVYLQINPVRDDAYTLTQSIVTTDSQTIAAKLNGEYARATK